MIIVIQNLLTKLMLIILAIAVLFTSVNDDGPVVYMYLNMILLGIVAYPTYIILFLIDTYKGVKIKVNWSLFIILTNGLVVYILGFLVETRYDSAEVSRHLTDFYFKYGMSFIYIPIVVALIIYVITLFKAPEELVEE